MGAWTSRCEAVLGGHGTRHVGAASQGPVAFGSALELLRTEARFRNWEAPPISTSRIGGPFEFVLVNDPFLAMEPEPDVFGP